MSGRWSAQDVPDQTGRVVVVTGATSGIGLETARVLGARGANMVMTGRNERKLEAAAAAVGRDAATPPEQVTLDLADLSSVADAAATITERSPAIDLLINNAGVMAVPERSETIDGFETDSGLDVRFAYGAYAVVALEKRETLSASLAAVEERISAAQDEVMVAFRELKRLELSLEAHQRRQRADADRREQQQLDEIALEGHRRRPAAG